MITFKEYHMLQEAPIAPLTPEEMRQRQDNNAAIQAGQTTPTAPAAAPADPVAQAANNQAANNQAVQNPAYPQGAPAGQGTAANAAAPAAAPAAPVAAAPAQQDPVTGWDAISNQADRIIKQTPDQAVPNLINLKQQFDQQALAASDAANAEREAGADGPAVEAIRDWNRAEQKLGQQARTLKSQIQDPTLQQQLTDVFGESWVRIDKGLPLIVEQSNKRYKIIVA